VTGTNLPALRVLRETATRGRPSGERAALAELAPLVKAATQALRLSQDPDAALRQLGAAAGVLLVAQLPADAARAELARLTATTRST